MKPSILVLGAGGFVGRRVVDVLQASGSAVPILGLHRQGSPASAHLEKRVIEATNAKSVASALRGVSAVVNCGAVDANTIVAGAHALIEAASTMNPRPRIIHLSSMTVYGSAEGLIGESAALMGDLGPYSRAQVAAESVVSKYPHAVILRPGCEFGPECEQWSVRIARLLCARRLGDLGAAGDGCCNLVHIDDVVSAISRALLDPNTDGRAFNLAVANAPSWNDFLTHYAIALGAVPVRRLTGRRLRIETKLLAPPLKIAEILARSAGLNTGFLPPPISPSLLRLMAQDIRLDSRAAASALGLTWKDPDAFIGETARWFLQQARGSP
jgi:nucleoside-diphosphate-sugar epimerase